MIKYTSSYNFLCTKGGRLLPPYFYTIKVLFLIATVMQFSCATPAQITRESSSPIKPGWIEKPPHENEVLYFVGISSSASTLEEGQRAALKDAMTEISNYLGSKIESVFESYITEVERDLSQQILSKSSAVVQGAKVEDLYYEKMVRTEKNFKLEKYDVYVLVSFLKEEAIKELNRQEKEKQEKVKIAYDYLLKGQVKEKERRYSAARRFYNQGLAAMATVEDIIEIDNGNIKNNKELQLRLKTQLQDVNTRLSKVALSINIEGPPQAIQTFNSNFAYALSEHGFTVTDEPATIKIIGEVTASKSSYVMNNYAYYAKGSVSAKRTSDHQLLAVYPFKVKGFHRSKDQAALNALAEAGIEAGNALSIMILKNEKMKKSAE